MARSKGYRTRLEHAREMRHRRAQLAEMRGAEWAKAQCVMQRIAWLLGNKHGPSGGLVSPRCCSVCEHFGHTKQYCPVRQARIGAGYEAQIEEERRRRLGYESDDPPGEFGDWLAAHYDKKGLPFVWEPGSAPREESAAHAGEWTWREGV